MQNNDVTFKHINAQQVAEGLDNNDYVIVDIRDANSYGNSHIPGAVHLTNDNLTDFLHQADYDVPTIVCCYHGISSQQAAQFLISQDFTDVYSLDGGFEQWAMLYPDKIER
ncbi:thiosulfate sulfurtransferase GlpE [Thalassotalea sp. PS06]|uniref:thiosulfate sulfurtransferase GlpE n=1 Tax=Thalassotalea sp. PS06 TaxID=2594005 RepID=UPI00116289F9|nr:thiosulfate sulfurtransferase GlpE [Thalassotalea sp. PS06]QDP02565.1 thiosulfate sulfurtransferase GlpE [Thalassotalea sp. PS06]